MTIFAIPCEHPDAKDGFYYCTPPYYDAPHMRDDYEYILVDTKKFIALLQQDEPEMLPHAESKFRGETAEQWLEHNSREHPHETAHFSYFLDRGLCMVSGNAGILKLFQELKLPCFPITSEKALGVQALNILKEKVAYRSENGAFRPLERYMVALHRLQR